MCIDDVPDLYIGTAAEHLVCADILVRGHRAYLADQICPYDVVVELEGGGLIRVQVKATRRHKSVPQRKGDVPAYMWHIRRAGKGGNRLYKEGEFDVLALVALDIKRIAYVLPKHSAQTFHIKTPGSVRGKQFSDYGFEKIEEEFTI